MVVRLWRTQVRSKVGPASSIALLLVLIMSSLVHVAPSAASPTSASIQASFFGITLDTSVTTWPVTLPFGTLGKTASGGPLGGSSDTYWLNLEPSNGTFDWKPLDNLLSAAKSGDIASVMYTLYETPTWASSNPTQSCFATANFGIYGCAAPPKYISDWDSFVTAVATRYKGQIQYYELWNEPNISTEYSGNITEMVNLAQHAYGIIKLIDPAAMVLTPGVSVAGTAPYTQGCSKATCWLAQYLQAGGGQYADAVAFHGKTCLDDNSICTQEGISCSVEIEQCQGLSIVKQIDNVRSLMAAYGLAEKPVIDTEGGYADEVGQKSLFGTADQQTATVSRFFILRASENLRIAVWFSWFPNGHMINGQTFSGLGTSAASSEINQAYAQTHDWLSGSTFDGPCSLSSGVWTCSLTSAAGYRELAVFGDTNSSATSYTPPSQYSQYQDLAGRTYSIPPGSSVALNEKPVLLRSTSIVTTTSATSTSAQSSSTTTSRSSSTSLTSASSSTATTGSSSTSGTRTSSTSSTSENSSTISSTTGATTSRTTTSAEGGGIPEFPPQLTVSLVFVALILASLLFFRRRPSSSHDETSVWRC